MEHFPGFRVYIVAYIQAYRRDTHAIGRFVILNLRLEAAQNGCNECWWEVGLVLGPALPPNKWM